MRHPEPIFHEHLTHLKRLYRPSLRYWKSPFDFIPLLDVLFLFACFFLASQSNLVRFGIPISLPSARTAEPIPVDASVLSVSSELMLLNNRWTPSAGLSSELRKLAVQSTNSVLIIEADAGIPHGELVRLYNTAREAGLHDIRLAALVSEPAQRAEPAPPTESPADDAPPSSESPQTPASTESTPPTAPPPPAPDSPPGNTP